MAEQYDPGKIEKKWQTRWGKAVPKATDPPVGGKSKYYALVEFPYPSGAGLHMGHVFTGTILDIFARKKRAEGINVLYPMGWDSFGLPTENYAIRTGIQPAVATKKNTDRFRKQMKGMALAYNWKREIDTTDPQYYRWTQWIFIQLFKHNLAYKREMPVGWCPSCRIVLANEEIINGACERCGHQAEYRMQKQWLLRITEYADRLTDDLDEVDYPDYVKVSQRNWIGRTAGVIIDYPIIDKKLIISCYSTRPDTNFGATFIVIAPEHPLVSQLTTPENKRAVNQYLQAAKKKSELERTELTREKTGVFTGSYALNRLNKKKMPIYVSDFVVLTAGTGVVVGVPAHDERDFEFAKKYGLEIIPVVKPKKGKWNFEEKAFTDLDTAIVFNSDFLNGLPALKAKEKIIDYLAKKKWGKRAKNYHLRDWVFSRQHYWGEPIPMVFCSACAKKKITWWETKGGKKFKPLKIKNKLRKTELAGWFPLSEDELPLELPQVKRYQPTDTGESPLAEAKSWLTTQCPVCQGKAVRETDTMPNWAGSSWYFLRYCDPKNKTCLADPRKLKYWLPVDLYLGGAEHTTLHLLYSRFWYKFLADLGLVHGKEPYAARRQHGVILAEDGRKMSKSLGNVVNPEEVIEKFGADTLRVYLMFMGPYEATIAWSPKGLEGCYRFLARVWRLYQQKGRIKKGETDPGLKPELHRLIKKVGEEIELLKHNTAIAALMTFLNSWTASSPAGGLSKTDAGVFAQLLAPFAPHLAEELWCRILGNKFSIHQQPWPKYDPKLIKERVVTIPVQVNGKVRGQIEVQSVKCKMQSEVVKLARKEKNVTKHLKSKKVKKTIFVPGRLINFVV